MSELDYGSSILLGILQGITEFLPVSSSGHLALCQKMMDLDPASPAMLLFDVLAHCGTLIAVIVVFSGSIMRYLRRLHRELGPTPPAKRYACRILLLAVAACIPTGVLGLAFKDHFEGAFDTPWVIGLCLIITGVLLAGMSKLGRGRRGWKNFTWWQAALVGVAQAGAILPGISRSGSTICIAAYLGLRRRWAAEFSFLIAVPAIAGGTLLKIKDTFDLPADQLANMSWGPIILGSVASLVVGIVALKLLLTVVRRAKLHYFAPYCWIVGAAVILAVN